MELIKSRQKTFGRTKELLLHGDSTTSKYFAVDLGVIEKDIANLKNQKDSIIEKITNVNVSIPTLEKYLELYVAVAFKAKITTDISIKDQIVKKFFLNLFFGRHENGRTERWLTCC